MKLNKKGMSLMELLVTIVLIGIVLTFIFQLLVDLRNERETNNFAHNNQINRIEIMHTIGDDLNKYPLQAVEDASSGGNITIKFYYLPHKQATESKIATLKTYSETTEDEFGQADKDFYVQYTAFSGDNYTWKMTGAEIDPCGLFSFYKDEKSNKYYFKLNIYVYNKPYHERNNSEVNNAVDDIEISYVGFKNELKALGNSLTNTAVSNKKIGACSN